MMAFPKVYLLFFFFIAFAELAIKRAHLHHSRERKHYSQSLQTGAEVSF